MDLNRLKSMLLIGSRMFGVVLLAGFLLAACGDDDDDDDDLGGDAETTVTVPEVDATEAETMTEDSGATEADTDATDTEDMASPTGDATEAEADTTGTGDDMTPTEADDGTATESDDTAGTPTESDSAVGTPTEEDGTSTPDAVGGTPTESDDGTATETDDGTATESDDATGTVDAATGDTAELGSEIEGDGFVIVVESVEPFAGMPGVLDPEAGQQFVAVTVTIENTDSDPLPLLRTLSSMHLETGDGERHDVDLLASAVLLLNDQGIMDTQIEAGSEVTGSVGFQIPTDAEDLTLVIEVDGSGDTVEIDLSGEM